MSHAAIANSLIGRAVSLAVTQLELGHNVLCGAVLLRSAVCCGHYNRLTEDIKLTVAASF